MNVISLTYQSANYYLIPSNDGWIMIDTGWPDTLSQLLQLLNQNNIAVNEVNYMIITHYHPGHAGLAQNLKDLGTNLILHESQLAYYNRLNLLYKKNPQAHFRDITSSNNTVLTDADSSSFFKSIGIDAKLISTPGHSDDSISLVISNECAFIGDLMPLPLQEENRNIVIEDSWDHIREFHVKTIYPGHGDPFKL
jgi:glyoxylase-like metal-dependent hydrolase (beta-lactamase superfamily II)